MPLARQYSDDAAQKAVVVPHAQLDLHRSYLGDLLRLLDLRHVDVAQPDAFDPAIALERGQCADARRQRRSRIGCVQLIQLDALDAERPPARLARGDQ